MGQTGGPSTVIQGPTCTPIVSRAWKKRETWKDAKTSFTWAFINVACAVFAFLDM